MSRWRENLGPYAGYTVGLTLLFAAIYGVTNYRGSNSGTNYRLHALWEVELPFVPAMICVYLSIAAAFALPLFLLERRQLRPFAMSFALATIVAGAIFLLLPARVGFDRPVLVPGYANVFAALYSLDPPYNSFPSLHVAYATLTIFAVAREARSRLLKVGLYLWLTGMLAAVVLVHQHHIADVGGGLLLGWGCYVEYRRRVVRSFKTQP